MVTAASALFAAPASAADAISDGQWYLKFLDVAAAHRVSQGEGVKVGLIDTGVDPSHPDLKGSVVAGGDFRSGMSGDGLTDGHGHGTAMASLIVGHGQIKGIAPKATVVSLKTSDKLGSSATAIGVAVRWAVDHDIKVISISGGHETDDLVLQQAISRAIAKDVVVVASVGNNANDSRVVYPAAYPGVVAVSGLDKTGKFWTGSVSGEAVQLAAPAERISAADLSGRRSVGDGTSNSAALVAGMVALIRSKYPDMRASEVIRRLTSTATDKGGAGRDAQYGFGVPNLVAALTAPVASSEPGGTVSTPAPVSTSRLAAPGAEFPVGIAVTIGVGCLVLVGLGAVLLWVFARRRRSS
ncbi:S8 family serine peptidase [Catellatospora sp. NPDC049111]|uniref:S8 family serine peptidase n=1 Tax=Catellatospora sp. NPDC049111 TaxID=3155271 RepID=UPI0033C4CF9B